MVAATQAEFGVNALYPVAMLSGLTDMDAITLSASQLVTQGRLDGGHRLAPDPGGVPVQFPVQGSHGRRDRRAHVLLKNLAPAFGAAMLAGAAILAFWPGSE